MNIITLDLTFQGLPKTIASYLIEAPGGPILVETGPGSTLVSSLAQLKSQGLSPADIKHVFVTHIHLDHAGAAGWWANQGARVYVHHLGLPHLVNPQKLIASASLIYGDQMGSLWGEIIPAPKENVSPLYDGDVIDVAGISISVLDTPGHASHHHVLAVGDIAFSGDAAGIRIPGTQLVDLPAPPPEFNLEAWQDSIGRLLKQPYKAIYPTHFGRLGDWRTQLETLSLVLEIATQFVKQRLDRGDHREKIIEDYMTWHRNRAQEAGMSAEDFKRCEIANPHYMSVDGITRYLRKKQK